MLARAFLFVAACSAALAPSESTPPVGAAPCVACRAPTLDPSLAFSTEDWLALEDGAVLRGADAAGLPVATESEIEADVPTEPDDAAASDGSAASDDSGETHADGLIRRPPEQVWTVLTDFERWPEFMPHIRRTHVERRAGVKLWVEQRYSILLVPMSHTTIYDLAARDGRLSWHLDEEAPHDIASSEGAWVLYALADGQHTLVRYQARIHAGRAVPEFVERMLRERSLEALLASLRDEVLRRYPEH